MLFPTVFWGDDLDMFGHLAEASEDRGEAFLFYSYAHVSGGALLVALCSGEGGARPGPRSLTRGLAPHVFAPCCLPGTLLWLAAVQPACCPSRCRGGGRAPLRLARVCRLIQSPMRFGIIRQGSLT